jgi:hypothetical protein
MPEAVVVAATRSPIGRANKGSLVDMRPDDLATQVVNSLMERSGVDKSEVEDLIMGCGQPAGESGFNVGRVVAVDLEQVDLALAGVEPRAGEPEVRALDAGQAEHVLVEAAGLVDGGHVQGHVVHPAERHVPPSSPGQNERRCSENSWLLWPSASSAARNAVTRAL